MATRVYKVGYATTDTPGDLKSLYADQVGASGRYQTFLTAGSYYLVPTGTTLYIGKVDVYPSAAGAGARIAYGDEGVTNSVTAPTNLVWLSDSYCGGTADNTVSFETMLQVPATKYPCMNSINAASGVTIYGLEL